MHKTRLQELCHQRMWPAPDYAVSRDGPDHKPCFGASVTVNGDSFQAPDLSKSSKEAQNKAALVAVHHFTAALPPNPSPLPPENDSDMFSMNPILNDVETHQENRREIENGSNEIMLNGSDIDSLDSSLRKLGVEVIPEILFDDELSSSTGFIFNTYGILDVNSIMAESTCSSPCNRVRVYPNSSDIVLPEGASVLSFSDDRWIAVSLDV